jgi:peroxiredoxin (alkyl hydroperoxide reductase subunit C)
MAAEPGQPAPDFTRNDQHGNQVSVAGAGTDKGVALVFYPFTFTGVCEGELCQLRDDMADFESADVDVIAVSCDAGPAQKVWAEQKGWTFPVVSDFWPHGEIAKAYGAFNDALGCANRVTVLIDKDGTIVDRFESGGLGTAREKGRYDEALAKLAG